MLQINSESLSTVKHSVIYSKADRPKEMVLLYSTTGSIQTSKAAATKDWNRIQHKGLQLIKSEPFTIELCLPINAKLVQMDYC